MEMKTSILFYYLTLIIAYILPGSLACLGTTRVYYMTETEEPKGTTQAAVLIERKWGGGHRGHRGRTTTPAGAGYYEDAGDYYYYDEYYEDSTTKRQRHRPFTTTKSNKNSNNQQKAILANNNKRTNNTGGVSSSSSSVLQKPAQNNIPIRLMLMVPPTVKTPRPSETAVISSAVPSSPEKRRRKVIIEDYLPEVPTKEKATKKFTSQTTSATTERKQNKKRTTTTETTTTTTTLPTTSTIRTSTTSAQTERPSPVSLKQYKCGTIPAYENKIDNTGSRASRYEIPWQARIIIAADAAAALAMGADDHHEPQRICGGALIANTHSVLTAASCFDGIYKIDSIRVILGDLNRHQAQENGEVVVSVSKVFKHKLYKPGSLEYDVAMLKIDEIQLSDGIVPVCLPGVCRPPISMDCITSGWRTNAYGNYGGAPNLHKTEARLIQRQSRCFNAAAQSGHKFNETQLICSVVVDPGLNGFCQADTGGPLVCRGENHQFAIEGILAFHTNCDSSDSIDVYIRTCHFSEWIEDVLFGTVSLQGDLEWYIV